MSEGKYEGRLHVQGIPEDEPLFLFRAQDKLSIYALMQYRNVCADKGLDDMAAEVDEQLQRFIEWQEANGSKLPD